MNDAVETRLALLVCSRYAQGADWNDVSAAVREAAEFTESATPIPALDSKECQDLFWRIASAMSKHIGSLTQASDINFKRKSACAMVRILRDRRENQIKRSIEIIDKTISALEADAKLLESNKKNVDLDAIKQRIQTAMLDAGVAGGVSSVPSSVVPSPKHMDSDCVPVFTDINETQTTEDPAVMQVDTIEISQQSDFDALEGIPADVRSVWDDISSHVYVQELMRIEPFSCSVLFPQICQTKNVPELLSLFHRMISDFRDSCNADDANLGRVLSLEAMLFAKYRTADAHQMIEEEKTVVNDDVSSMQECETHHNGLKTHGNEAQSDAKEFVNSESTIAPSLRGVDKLTRPRCDGSRTPKMVSSLTSTPGRKRLRSSVASSALEQANQVHESETEEKDIVRLGPLSSTDQTPQSSVPNNLTSSKKIVRKSKRTSIVLPRRTGRRRSSSAANASPLSRPKLLPRRGSGKPPYWEESMTDQCIDLTEQSILHDDVKQEAVEIAATILEEAKSHHAIQKKTRGTRQKEIVNIPEDSGPYRPRRGRRQSSIFSETDNFCEKEPVKKGRPRRKETQKNIEETKHDAKFESGVAEQCPDEHKSVHEASVEAEDEDAVKPGKRKRYSRKVAPKPPKNSVRSGRLSTQASQSSAAATRPRRCTLAKTNFPAKRGRKAKS